MKSRANFQTRRHLLELDAHSIPACRNSTCDPLVVTVRFFLGYLNSYYVPTIIVVGIVGNALSALVLLTTHLRLRSSSYYLAALAVSDSGFLACLALVYTSSMGVFDWYHREGLCQLWVYSTYVCSFLSVWFVVAFTVERFIAVRYPLRKPYVCTVSRAKAIVVGLTAVAFLLHLYVFRIAKVVDRQCHLDPEFVDVAEYFNYLDVVVTFVVPVVLIVGMNGLIARTLLRFRRSAQRGVLEDVGDCSGDFELYEMNNTQSTSSTKKSKENDTENPRKVTVEKNVRQKNSHVIIKSSSKYSMSVRAQQNINKMLLVISSVFIILNFPSYLVRLCVYFEEITYRHIDKDYMDCAQQMAMLLYYTNFSVNFLLYIMCGETFRLCLRTVCRNALYKCSLFQE